MGKKLLFVNLSKNTHLISLSVAEAERYGHIVYNIMDFPRKEHKTLRHVEYCSPTIHDYKKTINKLSSYYNIDYIVTQCDNLYPLLENLETNIKLLPVLTKIKINDLMDKQKFFNFCFRNKIPQPYTMTPTSIDEILTSFNGEIFLKPSNGADGTVRLFMTEEKYSQFDYRKFKNTQYLIDTMERYDHINTFLDVQKNGKEMKYGKGLVGIKGRHVIQDCVNSLEQFVINSIVVNKQIKFTVIQNTILPRDIGIYCQSYPHQKQYVISKNMDNHNSVMKILGKNKFNILIEQMNDIIEYSGMELSIFSLTFVPYDSNKAYIFDPHFRIGGGMSREIKTNSNEKKDKYFKKILFQDVEYHSIWEYI